MDSLLHVFVGAAIGEVLLGQKLGNRALAWGALFGSLPDADVLTTLFASTSMKLEIHRGVSHSLLFLLLVPFCAAPGLSKLWKRDKISRGRILAFVFLALASHLLLDCFTTYGTRLFAPFSDRAISFNALFIIDPFLWGAFILPVGWLAFLKKKDPKRLRLARTGLLIGTAYLGIALGAKEWVSSGFDSDLQRRQTKIKRRMEAPTPFNILLWRAVVDRGDEFWIGYKSVFELPGTPVRWVIVPKGREDFATIQNEKEAQTVERFSDGWWIARKTTKGAWLADLRFGELRSWVRKPNVDLRPMFAWEFERDAHDRLSQLKPENMDAGENLKRMALRIFGDRDDWEGAPRLSRNARTVPESLGWVE